VRLGEALIADVYEALRASTAWPTTLLFVLYDEHGGFYDHVVPPSAVVPDGSPPSSGFDFTRLGLRVPAIVVSPWIEPGTLDRERDASGQERPVVRDHTSVLATVEKRFGLAPLTARDGAAADVGSLLTRASPRMTDAEARMELPRPAGEEVAQPLMARRARAKAAARPLTDFQQNLLHLVAHVSLARTTGTTAVAARSAGGPTAEIAAPHLLHAAGLARRAAPRAREPEPATRASARAKRAPARRTPAKGKPGTGTTTKRKTTKAGTKARAKKRRR
jgi:phosphoesterase family protein